MKKVFGSLLPLLIAFTALLPTLSSLAQDYQRKINWLQNSKTFSTIDNKTVTQPTFTNAAHREDFGLLPVYAEQFEINTASEIKAQLINPVYSPVTGIHNNSIKHIGPVIQVETNLSVSRKKHSAFISILPFRKNPSTGAIEKLESFTLRLNIFPLIQRRSTNSYATSSVLASGNWYKLAVSTEGIFKVDYAYLKGTLNVDPAGISMNKLAIFGNGGGMLPDLNSVPRPDDLVENTTLVVDNNGNNQFDADDYLLFFAQMPDAWRLDSINQVFRHTKNLYSDKTVYFLTTDAGTGKRVSPQGSTANPNKTITDFDERAFHEAEEYNLLQSGKRWLGDKMQSFSSTKSFSFNFPNLLTSSPVKFVSSVAANSGKGSNTIIRLNGSQVVDHSVDAISGNVYPPVASTSTMPPVTYNANTEQINVAYEFSLKPGSTDQATASSYIDYFELNVKRALMLVGNSMPFRSISSIGPGNVSNFVVGNANSNTRVWDVTSISDIKLMQGSLNGSQFSFSTATDKLKEFVAFNQNAGFTAPEFIGKVENQNLHGIGQPAMVIISHDDFMAPSNDLAEFHRTIDNLTVSVVKLSQVYNEFASGKPDISAIRDFVRMLYERAPDISQAPKYLLLMGDGSFDPKGRIANTFNFIPTYQSEESESQTGTFTSDDYYGLLDPNEGGNIAGGKQLLDIGIGRIPVETETEAWDVVNKIKDYKRPKQCTGCVQTNSNNSWRNSLTFVADDEDGNIHFDSSDLLAEATRSSKPAYNFDKIYMDAYKQLSTPAGSRYPDVNTAILNKLNSGTLIINWVGHGGPNNWAHERIFNMTDISQLQNRDRLPLFITATCDFSAYDLIDRTAGESLIVNGKGGAIASITTVRLVYSNANAALNTEIFADLFKKFEGRDPRLGEVMTSAKNAVIGGDDVNARKFCLLGDPALQLNYPQHNVVTTSVNNVPIQLPHDTLKALSTVTIKGEIRDDNNNKLTDFSGVIYPVVYDKISTLQTLGNDAGSPIRNFKMYKNILFKGKASVTNGDFSFTFIVPKDINYQFGSGRISYYADNGNYVDAHGYSTDIVIGGSTDSAAVDNTGPKLKIFMNDEKFVFGGMTNASPVLLVKLDDESGINTVGNGIGHDLTAVLDEDGQNKTILNEYYESEQDNFKRGTVTYPYAKLADGRHSIRVKGWDIYNNSTEDYTEFIVTSNAKLALNHVYNYPNPFTTRTQFMFEHNRPCDNLNVSVQIYSVNGKLVKSIVNQQVQSQGYRVNDIEWDGLDDYGDPIGKGVYVYKVSVRDSNGNTAHKFEKLVVLR